MSLYDLAMSPNPVRTLVIIKQPGATEDDPGEVVQPQSAELKTALTNLARFIPTETVTIYLAAVSAVAAITQSIGKEPMVAANDKWIVDIFNQTFIYWVTAIVITPTIFLLIRAISQAKQNKKSFADFPYWKLTASVIAFLIWGLAIPNNPYTESHIAQFAFAFLAIIVSFFLELIDTLFEAKKARVPTE